jgi:hypothetical protein
MSVAPGVWAAAQQAVRAIAFQLLLEASLDM